MNNALLDNISETMIRNFPKVFQSLNDPAKDEDIERLNSACFHGNGVPQELVELYRWHNGQIGPNSFNQNDNFTFLSIDEVIDSYEFLNNPDEDIFQPYLSIWIPIFYNGSGDYMVYVANGEDKSKIVVYWHDDPERAVEYSSLSSLLSDALGVAGNSNEGAMEEIDRAWHKVNVVLEKTPPGGIKSLKKIKDDLNLTLGYGEIKAGLSTGRLTILEGQYYTDIKTKVKKLNDYFGDECVSVYLAEEPLNKISV